MQYEIKHSERNGRYRFVLRNNDGDVAAVSPVRGYATYEAAEEAALRIRDDRNWIHIGKR